MTSSALAKSLFNNYPEHRLSHLGPGNCRHREITDTVGALVGKSNGLLKAVPLGRSLEGRLIHLVTCGSGVKRVLLWSQMHGDEPTATLALMDMFHFLAISGGTTPWVEHFMKKLTLLFVPLLNPDGAERSQRHTAAQVDMNRDARALLTPEAQILRLLQRRTTPSFGFNLHDQELSSVGNSHAVAAISLLAPAVNGKRRSTHVRTRAMRVAGLMSRALSHFAKGHIATYDDSYEPRAFGDSMQSWGTSTILVESGHWSGDPEKQFIRRLNYVGLFTALQSIAAESYRGADIRYYADLERNGKKVYDIIIRNVSLEHGDGWSHRVDVGLSLEARFNRPGARFGGGSGQKIVTIKEVGDLTGFGCLEEIDAGGRRWRHDLFRTDDVVPLPEIRGELQIS